MKSSLRTSLSLGSGIPFAVIYGILTRLVFGGLSSNNYNDTLATMTLTFLTFVPFVVGLLTVIIAPPQLHHKVAYIILGPLASSTILLVAFFIFNIEALVCIALFAPLVWLFAIIGGVAALILHTIFKPGSKQSTNVVIVLALLPFVSVFIEETLPVNTRTERVTTSIDIAAAPSEIWPHIVRVAPIAPNDHAFRAAYLLGIPRPVEATLNGEGVGAMRMGRFDNGLIFEERVYLWQPNQRVAFNITPHAPSVYEPWDQIGKRYLNLLDAEYEIQTLGPNQSRLFLHTRVNITTRFNGYSAWWVQTLTSDFLSDLLQIVKYRSEAPVAGAGLRPATTDLSHPL